MNPYKPDNQFEPQKLPVTFSMMSSNMMPYTQQQPIQRGVNVPIGTYFGQQPAYGQMFPNPQPQSYYVPEVSQGIPREQLQIKSNQENASKMFKSQIKVPRTDDADFRAGRWTKEEHEMFIKGLEKYGKSWKDIAVMIPSRSLVQIRTHAQKYFQKQDRSQGINSSEGNGMNGVGGDSTLSPLPDSELSDGVSGTEEKTNTQTDVLPDTVRKEDTTKDTPKPADKSHSSSAVNTPILVHQKSPIPDASSKSVFPPTPTAPPRISVAPATTPLYMANKNILSQSYIKPNMSDILEAAKDTYYCPSIPVASWPRATPAYTAEPMNYMVMNNMTMENMYTPNYTNSFIQNTLPNYVNTVVPPSNMPTSQMNPKYPGYPIPAGVPGYSDEGPSFTQKVMQMLYLSGLKDGLEEKEKKEKEEKETKEILKKLSDSVKELKEKKENEINNELKEEEEKKENDMNKSNSESNKDIKKEEDKDELPKEEKKEEDHVDEQVEKGKDIDIDIDNKEEIEKSPVEEEKIKKEEEEEDKDSIDMSNMKILDPNELEEGDKDSTRDKEHSMENYVPKTPANVVCARSTFHNCVVQGDLEGLLSQLNALGRDQEHIDNYINHKDVYGYTPLMTAACLKDPELAHNICSTLLEYGADMNIQDNDGNTAFHWAAMVGHPNVLKLIYTYGYPPNTPNNNGDTALHLCCSNNRGECVKVLIKEMNVDETLRNNKHQTPLDVLYDTETSLPSNSRDSLRHILYSIFPSYKTLIAYHPNCLLHVPRDTGSQGSNPWEAPARLPAILEQIKKDLSPWEYEISSDFGPIDNSELKGIHSDRYIQLLEDLNNQVNKENQPVAFTPRVQRGQGVPEGQLKASDNCDTSFSKGSLLAAKTAAGGTCYAIDRVVEGRNRNAFVCVRPPGHHAGVEGLLSNSSSCGFCIYNNVFIGAVHALKTYPDIIKKVAIIDIDIHHGNGTEQLVQHYNHPDNIMFWSFHIYYNDVTEDYSFYPGTGHDHDMSHNVFNTPLIPLWAPNRYTDDFGEEDRGKTIYRKYIDTRMIPALRTFAPDLIMVSAGFDGGHMDAGNYGCLSNSCNGMNLKSDDYRYILQRIEEIADICCKGRVVSVLEGGYGHYEKMKRSKEGYVINRYIYIYIYILLLLCLLNLYLIHYRSSLAQNVLGHLKGLLGYRSLTPVSTPHTPTGKSQKGRHFCCCGDTSENKTMIECIVGKECGGWVHLSCAGIDPKKDVSKMGNFICKWCRTAGIDSVNEASEKDKPTEEKTGVKRNDEDLESDDEQTSSEKVESNSRGRNRRTKRKNDNDDDDDDQSYQYKKTLAKKSSYGFRPTHINNIPDYSEE
ncbi:hypothetical protein WA158_000493 [Blastocystis sp. Blastoise]